MNHDRDIKLDVEETVIDSVIPTNEQKEVRTIVEEKTQEPIFENAIIPPGPARYNNKYEISYPYIEIHIFTSPDKAGISFIDSDSYGRFDYDPGAKGVYQTDEKTIKVISWKSDINIPNKAIGKCVRTVNSYVTERFVYTIIVTPDVFEEIISSIERQLSEGKRRITINTKLSKTITDNFNVYIKDDATKAITKSQDVDDNNKIKNTNDIFDNDFDDIIKKYENELNDNNTGGFKI